MANLEWYVARDGQKTGPMSQSEIDEFHASNKLAPSDLVWNVSLGDWRSAASVFTFAPSVVPPPPPLPAATHAQLAPQVETTVVEGGSFKFGTFVWLVAGLLVPLWPISLPLCWFMAYRSYKKPSVMTVRRISA